MDPDAVVTIAFVSWVAVFALAGVFLVRYERNHDARSVTPPRRDDDRYRGRGDHAPRDAS